MFSHPISLLHISDLHFGRIQPDVLSALDKFMQDRKDQIRLVILTGDLTQRARSHEFKAALDFFSSLPAPLFLVPGNHDVPLYNIFLRFFRPYGKFMKYMGPLANNYYEDDHFAIYGLWTVNNLAIQTGKLGSKDLKNLEHKFSQVAPHKIKIITSHHPLLSIEHPRIQHDLKRVMNLDPHFMLWGHEHQSQVRFFQQPDVWPLMVASGTSLSSRTRSEVNTFNFMTFENRNVSIETFGHEYSRKEFYSLQKFQTPLPMVKESTDVYLKER